MKPQERGSRERDGWIFQTVSFGNDFLITKKINNSIDFLRHADETRFSNFRCGSLSKLGHFSGRMIPETKLIPKVD